RRIVVARNAGERSIAISLARMGSGSRRGAGSARDVPRSRPLPTVSGVELRAGDPARRPAGDPGGTRSRRTEGTVPARELLGHVDADRAGQRVAVRRLLVSRTLRPVRAGTGACRGGTRARSGEVG